MGVSGRTGRREGKNRKRTGYNSSTTLDDHPFNTGDVECWLIMVENVNELPCFIFPCF